MGTIAVFSLGMDGHAGPASRLAAVLARQGHNVLAWAPERHRDRFDGSGAHFFAHAPEPTDSPFIGYGDLARRLSEATSRCSEGVIEQLHRWDVELVVHDIHVPWARVAGDFLGLPRIVSVPLFPVGDFGAWVAPYLRCSAQTLADIAGCREAVGRAWGVDLGRPADVIFNTAGATNVCFTTAEICGRPEGAGHRYIGPLLADALPPLERVGRPLVYVSFGTFFGTSPVAFHAVTEGLAQEPVDVLVSTGRSRTTPADLEPLPANVVAREFVPAREVLARADVFVTHGGISSVHESLLAGVPMLCLPQGADQFDWARRVQELGAGTAAASNPAAIRGGLRQVLNDGRLRIRAQELGRHLAHFDGPGKLAALVQRLLKPAPRAPLNG